MDARVNSADSIVAAADSVYVDKRRWRVLPGQPPAIRARRFRRFAFWGLIGFVLLIVLLALTAPLSKSLQPITAPSVTLLSAEGRPIARRGSVVEAPVRADRLPPHVIAAFLAIEDRRFYRHIGVDPGGILRAAFVNVKEGEVAEGGSTISQQLAKLAFLSSDQTIIRKAQEAILAVWLETWLSKQEILSRYLSSVYFGDNVYGLRAAASHYFSKRPEQLSISEAAMLAGLVKAPSSLAPTRHYEKARDRARVVMQAMVQAKYLTSNVAATLPDAKVKRGPAKNVPAGTYFADWIFAQIGEKQTFGEQRIQTTLEDRLQRQAAAAIRSVGTGGAQVALVAMRPDGRVVAMVGGGSYRQSPFNRATQAKRQPGSTFKLFVYLAALRRGYTPNSPISDTPVRIGNWTPQNYGGKYRGTITLREALQVSSNVAAVRLSQQVGRDNVIRAARDLGITSELEDTPTIALGTSGVSLMEMVSAYASLANGSYPVKPRGLAGEEAEGGRPFEGSTRDMMLEMLWAVANQGTGRAAALPVPTFGKTGTTQNSRDAYFIGFAGNLVTGVWIGRDDNRPVGDVVGGGIPALIWKAFMAEAVKDTAAAAAVPADPATQDLDLPVGPDQAYQPGAVISEYDVDESYAPGPDAGSFGPPAEGFDYGPGDPADSVDGPAAGAGEPFPDDGPVRREDIPTAAPPPPPPPEEEPDDE